MAVWARVEEKKILGVGAFLRIAIEGSLVVLCKYYPVILLQCNLCVFSWVCVKAPWMISLGLVAQGFWTHTEYLGDD